MGTLDRVNFVELMVNARVAQPRAFYYEKRKLKWEYGRASLVKNRRKQVTGNLVAAPKQNTPLWSRIIRRVSYLMFPFISILIEYPCEGGDLFSGQ